MIFKGFGMLPYSNWVDIFFTCRCSSMFEMLKVVINRPTRTIALNFLLHVKFECGFASCYGPSKVLPMLELKTICKR